MDERPARAFRYGLALAVGVAWAASFTVELLGTVGAIDTGGYHTPGSVHVLMGIVVGAMVGDAGIRKARNRLSDQARKLADHESDPESP